MGRLYRVGEFAALTGVSVRTLHHYDRIGLLRPSAYSDGNHRRYAEQDLLRLQQVLTLRYLGFPLARIGELLRQPDFDLVASLRIQRRALRDRIAELERIDAALAELTDRRLATGRWHWDLIVGAASAVQDELAKKGTQMDAYYTPEQMKQFEDLGKQVSSEERAAIEHQWTELIAEVRANRELDPADPAAQALAARWTALIEASFRGNAELKDAVGEQYQQGRFADRPELPTAEDFAFIQRANEARDRHRPDGGDAG